MARTIAVTGKGGVGKTVVAALMIRYLRQHASGAILAVDADPDANLAAVLGAPALKTLGQVREETLRAIKKLPPGMDKAAYIEAGLHETLVETEKVDFLVMGRSEGPGCYCYVNNLLRKFADDLLRSYEWMVMDSEAGLEHLSRRTTTRLDHLVVVVNDSPLSIRTAGSIGEVIASVRNEVRHRHVLLNRVPEDRMDFIRAQLDGLDMKYLGHVPDDRAVEEAIWKGESLCDLDGAAAATVDEIMQKLGA